jgi:hypothetical protein
MHSRPEHPAVSMPKPHGPGAHGKKPSARLPVPAHGPMAHGKPHSARLPRAGHSSHATTDMFNVHRHGRKPNWWFVSGCALFMICYFLPWFSAGGGSLLGFEIGNSMPRYLREASADSAAAVAANSLWWFVFVGVWALFALGDEFTGMRRNKNRRWIRLATALAPVLALLLVVFTFAVLGAQPGAMAVLSPLLGPSASIGVWLMVVAMALCGVSVVIHPRMANGHEPAHAPSAAH